MPALPRYLTRSKSGVYKFQRGIPEDLRPVFGRGTTWRENLQTKEAAEARLKVHEVAARVERHFQAARARLTEKPLEAETAHVPPVHELSAAVEHWKQAELYRRAAAISTTGPASRLVAFHRESEISQAFSRPDRAERNDDWMARHEAEGRMVTGWAEDIAAIEGWTLPPPNVPPHPFNQTLYMKVLNAWLEVLAHEKRWLSHDYRDLPTSPPPERQRQPTAAEPLPDRASSTIRLSAALTAWSAKPVARSARTLEPRTVIEAKLAVRRFNELHGDLPLAEITKRHARLFRDSFARVPARLPKRLASMPMPKLLEEDLSSYPARTATTINKSMNLLAAIASHAEREGEFEDYPGWRNPFSVFLDIDPQTIGTREPFSAADLNRLLASPVFAARQRPRRGRKEAAKWLPLLALLHGARKGELLALRVEDVVTDPDTKILYLNIAPYQGRRVKNLGSIRKTPLHPKIVELGFLAYLEQRKAATGPKGSLWEGLDTPSRIKLWTDWFHDYLQTEVDDHPLKRFHSFRHTFKRFARDTLDAAVIDAMCGHVSGVAGGYGKARDAGGKDSGYSLLALSEAMAKVDFRGVDFSAVR